jgi:hypothetical protein
MKVKIDDNARKMYAKLCPTSTKKCESVTELDYKIHRCIDLGVKNITRDGKIFINYYKNRFEIDGDRIVDIRWIRYCQNVSENKKVRHYNKEFKVMV